MIEYTQPPWTINRILEPRIVGKVQGIDDEIATVHRYGLTKPTRGNSILMVYAAEMFEALQAIVKSCELCGQTGLVASQPGDPIPHQEPCPYCGPARTLIQKMEGAYVCD